jgi:peptide/nickel transport system substrate-binding protein
MGKESVAMTKWIAVPLGLILALGFSLPAQGASERPKSGGTLTVATRRDLSHLNPLVRTQSTDQSIRELMYESLLAIDLQGNIQPNLAESWEISPDGKAYTFRLRRGVKFHNGQEATAEDAKYAIDYTMNPKNGAFGFSRFALVDRVDLPDKYTLRFILKRPSAGFLYSMVTIQSFSLIPKDSLQEKLTGFVPGTGPFKFSEWKSRQHLVFERHGDYWGHKAFVDRLVFRPIAQETVRMTALRAGDVDMVEAAPYEWIRQIIDGKLKGIGFFESAEAGFRVLMFNVPAAPFNNKKLRLGVAYALNKKEILQAAYFGFGQPADQRYPKGHLWFIDNVRGPTYDPERARALLQEAGYKGETIELTVRQGQDQEAEATTIQAQLAKVGMNVKLDLVEAGTYTDKRLSGGYLFLPAGGSNDPDPSPTYGTEYVCPVDLKKRTGNSTGYCDKEMDALIAKLEAELNTERRKDLVRQIVQKVADDIPELPIGFVPRFFAYRDHVKGFTSDSEGRYRWLRGGMHYAWLDK